jgi:hypothetical protein
MIDEIKELKYNSRWVIFPCNCGFKTSKSRTALKHLKEHHELELLDGSINTKYHGNFSCDCGHRFVSEQVTIIYQFKKIHKFHMKCLKCDLPCQPNIIYFNKPISDLVLALSCRWKLTMKLIDKPWKRYKRWEPDHLEELCEACALNMCSSRSLFNTDLNKGANIKSFVNNKHQVIELSNRFDVLSVTDTVISNNQQGLCQSQIEDKIINDSEKNLKHMNKYTLNKNIRTFTNKKSFIRVFVKTVNNFKVLCNEYNRINLSWKLTLAKWVKILISEQKNKFNNKPKYNNSSLLHNGLSWDDTHDLNNGIIPKWLKRLITF